MKHTKLDLDASAWRQSLWSRIVGLNKAFDDALALEVFQYQAAHNPLYAEYLNLLNRTPQQVHSIKDIPFLPIQFFKKFRIKTGNWTEEQVFSSSGTTGTATSRHHLRSKKDYRQIARQCFETEYGSVGDYCWLALLPSYLERTGSSLIFMVDDFVRQSNYAQSGFFLDNFQELIRSIQLCQQKNIPTILLGVSFALLDLAEKHAPDLSGMIVMETGGMKGRRKEMTRDALHDELKKAFKVSEIHSEYGMTELFSQAYSKGRGIFKLSNTLRPLVRELTDPFHLLGPGKNGALNIIDLANLDTISFIATDDLGSIKTDGTFQILGRMDNSDIRGCNLLFDPRR